MRLPFKILLLSSVMSFAGWMPLAAQEAVPAPAVAERNDAIGGLLRGNIDGERRQAGAERRQVVERDPNERRRRREQQEADARALEPLEPLQPVEVDLGDYDPQTAPNVNVNGPLPAEANVVGPLPEEARIVGPLPDNDPDVVGAINNRALGVPAPEQRRLRAEEEDPYAALGIKAGTFTIRPTLDIGAGYNSNSAANAGGSGASFGRLNGDVGVESDWSRHAVQANVRGDYTYYKGNTDDNQLNFDADARGRVDITSTTNAHVAARAGITSERIGDPNLPAGVVARPDVRNYGATVGGTWKPNKLGVTVEGLVDRRDYEDADMGGGITINNSDRNLNEYGLRMETGYDVSDKLTPFVQGHIYKRKHDDLLDRNGFGRDSAGVSMAVGARYNLNDLIELNGSVGYQVQRFDDPRLSNLTGLIANGSLVWQPTALTTVTLNAATAFEETTIANAAGSVAHNVGVQVEHRLRRNLVLTGGAGFERASFEGVDRTDDTLRMDAGVEWLINRSMAVRANVAHEQMFSSVAGEDYDATLFQLGMRFRR